MNVLRAEPASRRHGAADRQPRRSGARTSSGGSARQAVATGDPALAALHDELAALPGGEEPEPPGAAIAVPLRLRAGDEVLSFLSTMTTFDTAADVTVAELAIESFFPADARTVHYLRGHRPARAERRHRPPRHQT